MFIYRQCQSSVGPIGAWFVVFTHSLVVRFVYVPILQHYKQGGRGRERGDNGLEMEMVLQIDEGVAQWAHWAAGVFGHLQLNLNTDNN